MYFWIWLCNNFSYHSKYNILFQFPFFCFTGEYVIKEELDNDITGAECGPSCDLPLADLPLPEFFLNDTLQLDEAFPFGDLGDEASQVSVIFLQIELHTE